MSSNVKCYQMSNVIKCQMLSNVKSRQMSSKVKCNLMQMSSNVKYHMRRCQIMVQFECGKTSFFKCQKKETLMHKINSKWYCWMYGARILQKNSPDHLFQVIRWSGAVLTFCSPKKLLFLQKSLFLDGAHTQIYNLFMKKKT